MHLYIHVFITLIWKQCLQPLQYAHTLIFSPSPPPLPQVLPSHLHSAWRRWSALAGPVRACARTAQAMRWAGHLPWRTWSCLQNQGIGLDSQRQDHSPTPGDDWMKKMKKKKRKKQKGEEKKKERGKKNNERKTLKGKSVILVKGMSSKKQQRQ